MAGTDIRLNSQNYILKHREDGSKILTRPVQQFVQSIKDTGRTRPEDVSPYETFIHPDLTHGFGRQRINSDKAFDPNEYRRFWDSTLDTRWQDAIYLPILAEDATQMISKTDSTELDVVKASASISGELYSLWSGPGNTIYYSQFTGASTTLAEDLDGSETGVDVTDASNLAVDDIITVGSEKMLITAISSNTLTVERDVLGTSAATHDNGDAVTTDTWGNNQRLWPRVTGAATHSTESSSYTFNVNIPADTDIFVMCVMGFDASNTISGVNSITIGGAAMTQAAGNSQGNNYAGIYYKTSPSTGATVSFNTEFQTGNSQTIDQPSFIYFSLAGANASSPSVATNVEDLSSTTSLSNALSTAVGDICIRAVAVNDDVTVTLGDDQIGNFSSSDASTSPFTHHATYQIATDTTTTMTGTLSEAESGATVAAAFAAGDPAIPIDITASAGNPVSLIVQQDDHLVFNGTSLATTLPTAGQAGTDVTDGQNLDAGLFATIGGELVLANIVSGSGIQFFSSTNNGTAWSSEISINSANGPQGLATYVGIDGEDKLYVATHEGIYEVDTSPSTWTAQLVVPMSGSNDNGRRMTVHSGSLWFAQGVDNDSPAPIYRMTTSGNSRIIESGYGLDVGDGVPSDMLGPVTYMRSTGDQLFIAIGGGASSRKARILAWNGTGWHHMYRNTQADEKIDWIDVDSGDDGVPRLHFAEREGTTESDVKFLKQPLVNPRSGVSIKRMDDADGVTGYVDLPYIDLGMPHENKNFLRTHVNGEDLNSSAANEYITITYGKDDAARTTTSLGSYTSATTVNSFQSNAGESAKNIGMRVNFLRGSTNTSSPKMKDLIVEGMIVPGNGNLSYQHEITIDIDQTATATGLSTESVYSNLKTLLATVTQVDFEFGAESRKVTVDRDNSAFLTYLDEAGYASAPNSMATRRGILRLVLVERIPLT